MKAFTFRGGVHPPYRKSKSLKEPLQEVPLAGTFIVPLSQHIGTPNQPTVKKGDVVEEGQMIGTSDSFISSPVHSPVSGKVSDIKKAFHPVLGWTMAVLIEKDPAKAPHKYSPRSADNISPEELLGIVRESGIVGMGGASFPTHVKLKTPEGRKIETLIVNGAECEPYLTCDYTLMLKKAKEIVKGIEIVVKLVSPKQVFIAVEDNKKDAFAVMCDAVKEVWHNQAVSVRVVLVKTKYPQGGEKQLIKAVAGKEVPPKKLPLDIGFLVQNVGTIHAIYEAVCLRKPLIERVVTVSGDCVTRPGNYLVRVGTTIKDMMEQAGIALSKEPKKMIFGGPMMGIAQPCMEAPVLKSTSGVLFLSEERARSFEEGPCVKCAKCVDICPMRLSPTEIMKNVKMDKWKNAEELFIDDCMECGACAYLCPARIPLVHYIKEGKSHLTAIRRRAAVTK